MRRLLALIFLMIGGALLIEMSHAQQRAIQVDIAHMQSGVAPPNFEFTLT